MTKRLPPWLRPTHRKAPELARLGGRLAEWGLNTVCQSARCPNLGECFSRGTATFLILGRVCTRRCRFCAVESGPVAPPDPEEPQRLAQAAKEMGLRHVVITSVTRDDPADGGAAHFAAAVAAAHRATGASVEVLVPDFRGRAADVKTVLDTGPEIFAHNLETVPRLYATVRPQADYRRSLDVLADAHRLAPDTPTKSGLMVGLGETPEEVGAVLRDMRAVGVSLVTIGQYLQPDREHLPVVEYVAPDQYRRYEAEATALGFTAAYCDPLVRSSYHAEELAGGPR